MQITISEIKEYLRISDDSQDNLLLSIKDGVIMYAKNYICKGELGVVFDTLPADLKLSILDHIAFLYDNRGSNLDTPSRILMCYKKYKCFKLF